MKSLKLISKASIFGLMLLASSLLVGCTTSQGDFSGQSTGTAVGLTENNYRIVKAGVKGESQGFNLFGIIPFVSPNYADAKAALYANVGESLVGRSVALANQTEDVSSIYVILFSIPKVTITADVIEFVPKNHSGSIKKQ